MQSQNTGLVTTRSSLPEASAFPTDDFTRKLFGCFREVFSADKQPERVIFWVEEQNGKFILRHVRNLNRKRKMEDHLVGMVSSNLDQIKIAIGNYVAGAFTTTVRWEIYSDFALSQLVECGRFDFHDLLPNVDFAQIPKLGTLRGDWDFDSIFLTHCCEKCKKIFNRESIIYIPHHVCESCGEGQTRDHVQNLIRALMRKAAYRKVHITTFTRQKDAPGFPVQHFLDPLPNSIMYWWLTMQTAGGTADPEEFFDHIEPEIFRSLYRSSIFFWMTRSFVREAFEKHIEGIDSEDWSLFVGQLSLFGELLTTNDWRRKQELFMGASPRYLQIALPALINRITMGSILGPQSEAITVQ